MLQKLYNTKKRILSIWESQWTDLEDNKLRDLKFDVKPWDPPYTITRRKQVTLTRLRIGVTPTELIVTS